MSPERTTVASSMSHARSKHTNTAACTAGHIKCIHAPRERKYKYKRRGHLFTSHHITSTQKSHHTHTRAQIYIQIQILIHMDTPSYNCRHAHGARAAHTSSTASARHTASSDAFANPITPYDGITCGAGNPVMRARTIRSRKRPYSKYTLGTRGARALIDQCQQHYPNFIKHAHARRRKQIQIQIQVQIILV